MMAAVVTNETSNINTTYQINNSAKNTSTEVRAMGSYTESYPDNAAKITYKIYLNKGEDGWIVVTSPDMKSLITQGRNEDEAARNALEVVD